MRIIALSGKAQAGKTTVARLIAAQVPGAQILGFATALRAEVHAAGFDPEWLRSKCDPARSLMQAWGHGRRHTEPGYWVRQVSAAASRLEATGCPLLLIDDLRYENEAEWLRLRGAYLIRLRRIRHRDEAPALTMDQQLDDSETALDFYQDWNLDVAIATGDEVKLAGTAAHAVSWAAAQSTNQKGTP